MAESLAAIAQARGLTVSVLAQEMPGELRIRGALQPLPAALRHVHRLVVPSEAVAAALAAEFKLPTKVVVVEPGLDGLAAYDPAARRALRAALNMAEDVRLLLGVGPGDLRHGFDLFLQLFRRLRAKDTTLRGIWIGRLDTTLRGWLAGEIAALGNDGLSVLENLDAAGDYLSAADLLALTAREASLPALAQQAVAAGLPILAFSGAGGTPALIAGFVGQAVPLGDVEAMAEAARGFFMSPKPEATRGRAFNTAQRRFDPRLSATTLLGVVLPNLPDIAVVVAGQGLGGLLANRLLVVFGQDLPVRDVIVLADSADPKVAEGALIGAQRWKRLIRVLPGPDSGAAAAAAQAALAASAAELIWLTPIDLAPSWNFLRQAASALARAPKAPFAAAGSTPTLAATLWRRAALAAALTAAGKAVDGSVLLQAGAALGAPALLPDVPTMALALVPTPPPPSAAAGSGGARTAKPATAAGPGRARIRN